MKISPMHKSLLTEALLGFVWSIIILGIILSPGIFGNKIDFVYAF